MTFFVRLTVFVCSSLLMGATAFAEPGVTSTQITFGRVAPLTGATAEAAKAIFRGADLYLASVNAKGGVHGRKIVIQTEDDHYDPQKSVELVKNLIKGEKIFGFFLNYGSASAKSTLPLFEKSDVPSFAVVASTEEVRVPVRKNLFFVRVSSQDEMTGVVKYAHDALGSKSFAIVSAEDALGEGYRLSAMSALRQFGLTPVASVKINRADESVDPGLVDKLIGAKPDAVILGIQLKPSASLIRLSTQRSFKPVFLGSSNHMGNSFTDLLSGHSPTLFISMMSPPLVKDSPFDLVRSYLHDVASAGESADESHVQGYLSAMVLVEALKRTGPSLSRESFRKSLESMNDVSIGGIHFSYSPSSHRGNQNVFIVKLVNGGYVAAPEKK